MSRPQIPDSDSRPADSISSLAILPRDLDRILDRVRRTSPRGVTRLVAIDGRGGSGKTRFARMLRAADRSVRIIQVDHFPCEAHEHPFAPTGVQPRISVTRLVTALLPLIAGDPTIFRATPWVRHTADTRDTPAGDDRSVANPPVRRVRAGGTVLVEGSYALLPPLRPLYDLAIWIECDTATALRRARERDGVVGAAPGDWERVHVPNQERYISIHQPAEHAEIVLETAGPGPVRLTRI